MSAVRNFIDGTWIDAGPDGIERFDPATGEALGKAPRGTKADIDAAVDAAKRAFPAWADTPAPVRADILFRLARVMEERKEELGRLVNREMGKVKIEALADVQEAIDMAYYIAGEGRRLFGNTTPSELPNKICMTLREPIGVCGLITPWNFPVAIPSWKSLPALVCGNTVVHQGLRGDGRLRDGLRRVPRSRPGFLKGVVNLVHGLGGGSRRTRWLPIPTCRSFR